MEKSKLTYLLVLLLLISVHSAHADSPVWKIVKGDNQLFIGGTIHVLTVSDYPLPATFEKAYDLSSKIVLEADYYTIKTPEFQKRLMTICTYPEDRNLKTVLNDTTYKDLEQYLSSRGGLLIDDLVNYKPGLVAVLLANFKFQRLKLGPGVGKFYSERAINDQKSMGYLETADEQLVFISTMGYGREDEFIAYTLHDLKKPPESMQSIKEAWRQGDNRKLEEIDLAPFQRDFPDLYAELIVKKNNLRTPKIEALLKTKEVEFLFVDMIYLAGKDGILAQLAAKGYIIEKP